MNKMYVMNEWCFARYEFGMYFRRTSYITMPPWYCFIAYALHNFMVRLSDERPSPGNHPDFYYPGDYPLCGQYEGTPPKSFDVRLRCHPVAVGRFVYIHIPYKTSLIVCGVAVYGTPSKKPARGKRKLQCSVVLMWSIFSQILTIDTP